VANQEPISWEESFLSLAGETSYYWYTMSPVRSEGAVVGAVIVARDITEKRLVDAQLMTADRMASVGFLAAGVAHEINNPLAILMAKLDLVEQQLGDLRGKIKLPPQVAIDLVDVRQAAGRIDGVVSDLQFFSRDGTDSLDPVDVRSAIESVLRLARYDVQRRATLVEDYGATPLVEANERRLGQVVLNLVVNAVHAIGEGNPGENQIRIHTALDERGRVVIAVRDTGCGIPPVDQKKLFTPFFTTKPPGRGTGLGLSISRRIVESFNGEMTFDSKVGEGTEFRIYLSPARTARRVPLPSVPAPRPAPGRLSVIDDNEASRLAADTSARSASPGSGGGERSRRLRAGTCPCARSVAGSRSSR
jgi:signal transduction histidine kinase